MSRWFERRRASQVKKTVHDLADSLVVEASRTNGFQQVADLIPVVEKRTGLSITVVRDDLQWGQVGYTTVSGNTATIVLDGTCATVQHTLAHELGHLALGHRHFDLAVLQEPPASCAGVFELMFSEANGDEEANENEAELFAYRILQLVPRATDDPVTMSDEMLWKVALLK